MKQVSELRNILSDFFNWHKCRLDCLGHMVRALFVVKTINLTQIAIAFQSNAKAESSYRRVRRFLSGFTFDLSLIVALILRLFPQIDENIILIMDRTNWKWGTTPINILTISIAYRGIGIPLFWVVLDLEGNSCTKERIELLQRVIDRLGVDRIKIFLADREFVGTKWFRFLIDQKIPFAIRIKQNSKIEIMGGETLHAGRLSRRLKQKKIINYEVTLWGHTLDISIEKKKGAKEQMIVVSNKEWEDPLGLYRRRWEIETMFGCLKTRGFRLEDTHVTDPDRIEKILFILALGFCWSYRVGDIRDRKAPIKLKAHGRKARSLFREGLDRIREVFIRRNVCRDFRKLLMCFSILKPVGYAI